MHGAGKAKLKINFVNRVHCQSFEYHMITLLIINIIITEYFLLENKTWVIGRKKKFDVRACDTLLTQ